VIDPTSRISGPVRSVEKAARILLLFGSDETLTAREVAERLSMPVPTAYNLLETLVASRLLGKTTARAYELGPAVGVLSDALQRRLAPPTFLLAPLHELAGTTRETAYLSRWQDDDAVILATVEGVHELRVSGLHSGTRGHAHARASGKLFLAHATAEARERHLERHPLTPRTGATITDRETLDAELERIRAAGLSYDREEFAEGVTCVSAPVLEHGVVIATYTVAAPTVRFDAAGDRYPAAVRAAAAAAAR
jgi:IclR family transcriptional regulator, acetate operon repressor